jgi:hypothetical protein
MIIQSQQQKKKEFRAFESTKVKRFKALNSPEAWLALLKLSIVAAASP